MTKDVLLAILVATLVFQEGWYACIFVYGQTVKHESIKAIGMATVFVASMVTLIWIAVEHNSPIWYELAAFAFMFQFICTGATLKVLQSRMDASMKPHSTHTKRIIAVPVIVLAAVLILSLV